MVYHHGIRFNCVVRPRVCRRRLAVCVQIVVNDTPMFFQRYGRGVPVMVMHGGPGIDHSYFRPYLDALGDVAELIYYDHRGCGRSGGRDQMGQITLEHWAEDAHALRLALKIDKMVLLGHGFGGFIAQTYARMFPDTLRGLVLTNTSPALDYPVSMLTRAQEYGGANALQALMAAMRQPAPDDETLRASWCGALPAYFYRYQPMFGAAMDDGMIYSAPAYNRGMFTLAPHFNSCGWLKDIRTQTLVMAGAHDWLAPPKEGAGRLMAHLPYATLQMFEHSGHYPFVEEPTAYGHTLRMFVRQLAV
jgi:proline iminopeptidase